MNYEVTIDGVTRRVSVLRDGDDHLVRVDDGPERRVASRALPGSLSLLIEGLSLDARLVRVEGGWDVDLRGVTHRAQVVDPRRKALRLASGAAEGDHSTSMPGRVVALLVAPGDAVTKGQPVLVMEAMKMENEIKAKVTGVVDEVFVSPGQALEAGARLLRVRPDGA